MCKVFGVVSLKGGVGKTSVVVALGAAIAGFGKKVLLVDANLSAPNLGLHLNVVESGATLHHVLARKVKPKEAVHELEFFDILPASIFERVELNPLKLKDRIKSFREKYDFILIDSSPSLDDETLAVILASDELLVVTTPDHPTLSTTIKAVNLAKKRGTTISGLILNKVYNKNFEISFGDMENILEVPIMAVIPHDINILKALSEFKPSTIHKPKSEASEEFKKLASTLIGEKYKPVKIKSLWRWINPKRQDINRTIFYENVFK